MKLVNTPILPRGFSMVEVAMALGILSFALITIMGLIPTALHTSRSSLDRSVAAHIVQAVQAQLVALPYSELPSQGTLTFDASGELVANADTQAHYRVVYSNQFSTQSPGNQSMSKLVTSQVILENIHTRQKQTNSIHLPDNGF